MCSDDLTRVAMKGCLCSNVTIIICRGEIAFCGNEKIYGHQKCLGVNLFFGSLITRHPLPRSKCAVMKHALQARSNFVTIVLQLAHEFEVLNACIMYMPKSIITVNN